MYSKKNNHSGGMSYDQKTEFPIIIYNNPPMSKVNLEFETISRLGKIENIIGIKDSSGNYPLVERLKRS